ncbi:MAG: transketolase [Lachnospiraceae bacterium]|nr:transketolase [Lachnospiraceae bacterium]
MSYSISELEKAAMEIRINLLKLCNKEVIHIGGDLSLTDVMTVLWLYKINYDPKNIKDENRDRFVLSKGHASAVTSFCQAALGCFSPEDVINEYAKDSGRFSMHSCNIVNPFVEVSTGSLGHGMPIACGMAAGLKLKNNRTSRVYTVMGDGEQSEGSIWEAAMNAVHCKLGNLVAIVDNNGLQADGYIDDLTGLGNIADKYRSFGWNVVEIDGNNIEEIKKAFDSLPSPDSDVPTCIIAHTVKGKGVDFMEDLQRWHAGKITDEQLKEAVDGLEKAYSARWQS